MFDDLRGRIDGLIVERLDQTPFYLESDAHPMIETADVAEAVAIVQSWLQGEPTPV